MDASERYYQAILDIHTYIMNNLGDIAPKELYHIQYRYIRIMSVVEKNTNVWYHMHVKKPHSRSGSMAMYYATKSFTDKDEKDKYLIPLQQRFNSYQATLKFVQLTLPLIYHNKE